MAVTIRVPAAVRLATVGRLPQARCPAGLVNPCRVLRAGRAAPLRAGRRGRQPGPAGEQVAEHSEGVLAILAGGGQVGADREERPGIPDSDRQPPEIFCCSFTIRTSRSAWLLSTGTRKSVSYTHLRAHETVLDLVCRL